MEKNNKQKFTYVKFHTLIYTFAIVPIVVYIMHQIKGKDVDWISAIVGAGIVLVGQLIVGKIFYKMETKDEMVQYNLAKANKITLYTLFAVMFVGLILDNFIHGFICTDFCWLTLFGGIALRSLLFTFFDNPSQADSKEEEE